MNKEGNCKSSNSTVNTRYLTKNDLCRLYAITNVSLLLIFMIFDLIFFCKSIQCAWNPNLSAFSWLVTTTKSGLCRLTNYPMVNPERYVNNRSSPWMNFEKIFYYMILCFYITDLEYSKFKTWRIILSNNEKKFNLDQSGLAHFKIVVWIGCIDNATSQLFLLGSRQT